MESHKSQDPSVVPFLDLRRALAQAEPEFLAAFRRVLAHGQFILGPEVAEFEKACADHIGVPHAIGVSSGSDALLAALMALELGPNDEVICPTFTFFATAGAIWRCGAKPVFVDIDLRDFNASRETIATAVTNRTRAIIVVHLFGQCADMEPILELARAHALPVIEDAAQAIGARTATGAAGALGLFGCFSFFPSKNLGGLGDGGLVTTRDESFATRLRVLRVHGAARKYHHEVVGGNFRLDALQAALLKIRLTTLDQETAARQSHAAQYGEMLLEAGLAGEGKAATGQDAMLILPAVTQPHHVYNQFVVRVPHRRDALRTFLTARGIGTEIYYPLPLHLQPCFSALGYRRGAFPNAELAASEALALPIFGALTEAEITRVATEVINFFRT